MRIYGTFADSHYLPQLLSLIDSFSSQSKSKIAVIALDQVVYDYFLYNSNSRVDLYSLDNLLHIYPELSKVRYERSYVDFCFTVTSTVPSFLFDQYPASSMVVYLDADLYFFKDPDLVLDFYQDNDVILTPHNFSTKNFDLLKYGIFNTGIVGFSKTAHGMASAKVWMKLCLEWCHDIVADNKYADQKYLERFLEMPIRVGITENLGFNLGPWGIDKFLKNYQVVSRDDLVIDGIFAFHFSGIQIYSNWISCGFWRYRIKLDDAVFQNIYIPYLKSLNESKKRIAELGLIDDKILNVSTANRRGNRLSIFGLMRAFYYSDFRKMRFF